MPYYDFQCTSCAIVIEDIMLSYENRDLPLTEACPACNATGTIERLASAPNIGDAVRMGRLNLPNGWTNRLARIKERMPGSTMTVPSAGKREI